MAFDNSYTAVTGATYQASDYNTGTKGNFTAVWVGTTAGDMDYYTSATAKNRLAIGAAGGILTSSGSAPQWTAVGAANTFLRSSGLAPIWRSLVHGRQGGSSTEWPISGTTAYTPSASLIQMGSVEVTVSSGGWAYTTVTYPTAYTERPLIFLSTKMTGALATTWSLGFLNDEETQFQIHLKFTSTTQTGTYSVMWMAVGV